MHGASIIVACYVYGNDKGPKKKHFDTVQRNANANGYTCRDVVQVYKNGEMAAARVKLVMRRSHCCFAERPTCVGLQLRPSSTLPKGTLRGGEG